MADGDFQSGGRLLEVLFAPDEEAASDALDDLVRQVDRRAAAFARNAADVRAAFQGFIGKHVENLLGCFVFIIIQTARLEKPRRGFCGKSRVQKQTGREKCRDIRL